MIREHFDPSPLVRTLAWIAAAAVVAGGVYYVATRHGAAILEAVDGWTTHVAPKKDAPPAAAARQDAPRPRAPAVYRCTGNGAVTYSDAPCPGGEVIELVVPKGFEPTPVPGAPRQR